MAAVVKLGNIRVVEGVVTLLDSFQSGFGERANRFPEVPVRLRVVQVERFRLVIGDDPGEHRVLGYVVVRPTREGVERHDVVKVAHLAAAPARGDVALSKQRLRGRVTNFEKLAAVSRPQPGHCAVNPRTLLLRSQVEEIRPPIQ